MKPLFSVFQPDYMLKTAAELTPEWLAERGIKGVIFDIDGTLVPQDQPADDGVRQLFGKLHEAGIKTFFVSNNKPERVQPFAAAAESGYVCCAGKPRRRGYKEALRCMALSPDTVLAAGDQLLTDIWGAGRTGIRSAFVEPLSPKTEVLSVRLKRPLEKILFYFFRRRDPQLFLDNSRK